jgi:ubiquinone/menaquinone biosynthesis C-methylase UbiE
MAKKTQTAISVDNDVDERMVPSKHRGSGIYGEHVARYMAAANVVKGKAVLDIASGSGYGTAILGEYAQSIVGVDVSKDAIDFAKKEYSGKNITYKKSDGKTIPFADDTFDVIVSFETIEHLEDYNFFMQEIKRVLKEDGLFILSTPNELEFAEGNHFHLHEFEQGELINLAKQYYSHVKPFFQSTWIGNLVGTKEEMTSEWQKKIVVQQLEPIAEEKFLYFYLLCANRPIRETITTRFTISQHSSDRTMHEKNILTQNHISNLEAIVKGHVEEQAKLNKIIEEYQKKFSIRDLPTRVIGKARSIKNRD